MSRRVLPAKPGKKSSRGHLIWGWCGFVAIISAVFSFGLINYYRPEFLAGTPRPLPVVELTNTGPGVRQAIEEAVAVVRQRPRSGPAWGRLGMVLLAHNFEAAAGHCFLAAQDYDPQSMRWRYYAGVVASVSDLGAARRHFEQAVRLSPDDPLPRFRLAELLMDIQAFAQARQVLNSIVAPGQGMRLLYDRVRLLLLDRDFQGLQALSQNDLKKLEQGENRKACLELLAQVYQRLGNREKADQIAQQARDLPLMPEGWEDQLVAQVFDLRRDPAWLASQASKLAQKGRIDQAEEIFQQLVAEFPDDPQWHLQFARLKLNAGDRAGGFQILQSAADQFPAAAQVQFEIGNLHFQAGEWQAAADSYHRAIASQPDHALSHYNLGHAWLKLKNRDAARDEFRAALRSRPDLPQALVNLGDLLSQSPDPADRLEARRLLDQAIRLSPADQRARELLDTLSTQ